MGKTMQKHKGAQKTGGLRTCVMIFLASAMPFSGKAATLHKMFGAKADATPVKRYDGDACHKTLSKIKTKRRKAKARNTSGPA